MASSRVVDLVLLLLALATMGLFAESQFSRGDGEGEPLEVRAESKVGTVLPPVEIETSSGEPLNFPSEFARTAYVVVFLRSDRHLCEATAPTWSQLSQSHPLVVVSAEDPSQAEAWLDTHSIEPLRLVFLKDHRAVTAGWHVARVPTTIVFSSKGEVLAAKTGVLTARTWSEMMSNSGL